MQWYYDIVLLVFLQVMYYTIVGKFLWGLVEVFADTRYHAQYSQTVQSC
jgi:thiamine transporter ThiT